MCAQRGDVRGFRITLDVPRTRGGRRRFCGTVAGAHSRKVPEVPRRTRPRHPDWSIGRLPNRFRVRAPSAPTLVRHCHSSRPSPSHGREQLPAELTCRERMWDAEAPANPLQDAWAREVQRRHMAATMHRNGTSRSAAASSRGAVWQSFEHSLQPTQPRFANFSRYGFMEVPAAVEQDLREHFFNARRTSIPGPQPTVSDAEFRKLPERAATGSDQCVICLNEIVPADAVLKQLPCGHAFHGPCLRRWLKRSRACPCCRGTLGRKSQRRMPPAPAPSTRRPERMAGSSSATDARAIEAATRTSTGITSLSHNLGSLLVVVRFTLHSTHGLQRMLPFAYIVQYCSRKLLSYSTVLR